MPFHSPGGGGSISELDDIGDVNAPSPNNTDVLMWDSTPGEWVAAPADTPGAHASSHAVGGGDALTNVPNHDHSGDSGDGGALGDQVVTSRMVNLTLETADVTTAESTSSTTYADLATSGPAVTLSPGATQDHLLITSARLLNVTNTHDGYASVAIAGATAQDVDGAYSGVTTTTITAPTRMTKAAAQTSGATHTMKYRVSANSTTFDFRRLIGTAV